MNLNEVQQERLRSIRATRNLTCAADCGHTPDEHDAIDLGIADGEAGLDINPYELTDELLNHLWESGHSTGSQMARVKEELSHREKLA